MAVYIGSTSAYMRLDSWRLAKVIQLTTFSFCRRFFNRSNDPDGKQFGQTTGAARAVPANIAEGSARHNTSIETEMRLLDVARASISELIDDMMFILMANSQTAWREDDPRTLAVRNIRLEPVEYSTSMLHDASEHLLKLYEQFKPWTENDDVCICANAIIVMSLRVVKMLRNQLNKRLDDFSESGGFSENMTDTRLSAKRSVLQTEGAPTCPKCGAVMMRVFAKRGVNAGNEFWGCSQWKKTGCDGSLPISRQ